MDIDNIYNNDWVYYSHHVEGYTAKYGDRGIRDRNGKILKSFKKEQDPGKLIQIRQQLVENNLPLARAVAEQRAHTKRWKQEKTEEAYANCCLALTMYCMQKLPHKESISANYFQVCVYYHMLNAVNDMHEGNDVYDLCEIEPLDEETVPAETKTAVNLRHLQRLFRYVPERDYRIIMYSFIGKDGIPYDNETIADYFGITTARVYMLKNKAIEKIKKQLTHFHLTTDDFLMDETFQLESAITEEITYRKINKYFPL